MTTVTFVVLAQREDNYAWSDGGEAWKKKGGTTFEVKVPDGISLYEDDLVVEYLKRRLLPSVSNDLERYTYADHQLRFNEVQKIEFKLNQIKIFSFNKFVTKYH